MDAMEAIRGRVAGKYALPGFGRLPMGNLLGSMVQVVVTENSVVVARLDLEEVQATPFRVSAEAVGEPYEALAQEGVNRFAASLLECPAYGLRPMQLVVARQWAEERGPKRGRERLVESRPVESGREVVFLPCEGLLAEAAKLADELDLGKSYVSRLAQLIDAYRGTSDRTRFRVVTEGGAR